ncbi:MAG: TIGR01777 family oxidoreductase [Verrucomicrobiales bacterium]|nr:TIGR01777 family oxidoreductase [Verrucomicrobiales bacterium]
MPDDTFHLTSTIAASAEELRAWHFRQGAFNRLNPPWEKAQVIESFRELEDGARAVIDVGSGPMKQRWIAEHELIESGFIDRQVSGPFASWEHRHLFEDLSENTSKLTDSIHYRLPMGVPGRLLGNPVVVPKLRRMFRYRHAVTKSDLERRIASPPPRALSVLITGATGLIGQALTGYLQTQGHTVHTVTRTPKHEGEIRWNPEAGEIDWPSDLQVDGVVHLAGENVGERRWTAPTKHQILESRRLGTRLISGTIAKLPNPPAVLVSASGSGFYPHDGSEHDESSPVGNHFLADVCKIWEAETKEAEAAGIRVVHPRIGAVLTPAGGMLKKLTPLFLAGLGGPIGSGRQQLSWISIDDVIDILHRALFEEEWCGPLNVTAPEIVTNREFTRTLASMLRRPALLPVPAGALKLALGEMADETILADIAAIPKKLQSLGYQFRHPDLISALSHVLGKDIPRPGDLFSGALDKT